MFVQNWVGPSVFTLEPVDIYLPNKITTQPGKTASLAVPSAQEPGTALTQQVWLSKGSES